jgi:3-oxoacyl-[acyl-carrier-protein] synthase II
MLLLNEVDLALSGGVSECAGSFGIFAGFKSEGALASRPDPEKACRPFDKDRNGVVVSEGGYISVLQRLSDAPKRGTKIYSEIVGYAINSDATDFIFPSAERQVECMKLALNKAVISPEDIDIISTHGTGTVEGDAVECEAIREVFDEHPRAYINDTKSLIGHAMGAAGALELAGDSPSSEDHLVHPTINLDHLDPKCHLNNLVINEPKGIDKVDYILNNSFGMLGINSVVVVGRFEK